MYEGYTKVTDSELASIYQGEQHQLRLNQYVITESNEILRYDGKTLMDIRHPQMKGLKPKNAEQKMAFDLLANQEVPIKTLIGIAGSGKTKLGLAFGLHALNKGQVKKLFVVRQPSPVGEEIGFLKGSKEEKLAAWFKPILDNLDGGEFELQALIQRGMIEFEAPAFMQGRDLQETYVLIDEAQLLTYEQVKMLGSRIGNGSSIVFAGDYDQIFNKKYKGENNGLIRMVEIFEGDSDFGIVALKESVRGRVAEKFATKM